MNLILLEPHDVPQDGQALLHDQRRLAHLREVHRAQLGDSFTVGCTNGLIGKAELTALEPDHARLNWTNLSEPPPPPACSLGVGVTAPAHAGTHP